ncbi:hypothetical protein RGU70_05290 [Herbaspirillum sp. RTI4]|uniref:hypothetical protein n=1 Tax=Herbaspirillum sp. RTI4 TaxID=3048640 RepID=UPI002AB5B3D1|nr:hypothetical protein [Herbaspirillum sp. RTI4]MDY7577731.1 hypothetical protein [Herbaspirillum sp. RTI4]MEA9980841.1 hypothetical protein [Herbaspirillum sp. RTI4]
MNTLINSATSHRPRRKAVAIACGLSLCVLAASPHTAFAEPGECKLTVSTPELDLGNIGPYEANPKDLKQGLVSLNQQTNTLHVLCPQPTRFAIYFRATPGANGDYRINGKPDAATLRLKMRQVHADGKPASWASRQDASRNGAEVKLLHGDGVYPLIGGQSLPVTQLSASVDIETLFEASLLRSGSDRDLSGEGQFEIVPF